jgi:hypothetical protein
MPTRCIQTLDPEQYVQALEPVFLGKDALTHVALIDYNQQKRRWYLKVMRDPGNRGSPRGLTNEIIGHVLAHHAGLPQPKGALIYVATDTLRQIHPGDVFTDPDYLCFASLEAHNPYDRTTGMVRVIYRNLVKDIQFALLQWPALPLLMAFDSWVANIDRNTGNIIQSGTDNYFILDHGHLLTGPNWTPSDLRSEKDFVNKLMDELFYSWRLPLNIKSAVLKSVEAFFPVFTKALPELDYWLSPDEDPDIVCAQTFITERADQVKLMLKKRLKLVAQ